jgi:glutamate synthase (NADPH/NADH) small chain
MAKITGFMEYERALPHDRNPLTRVQDWEEFHIGVPEEQLVVQAARCMDCGTPYCHTGMDMRGGTSGCPLHNLIPEWNNLIYRHSWRDALERLHKTNNFPEFTGRVCPAPCEGACTVGLHGEAVTIKSIEQAIVDHGFAEGWITPEVPKARTGKRVAVVGSGPTGLAAAAQLNKAGHTVTVYERADRIGGLLTYGIPQMKLNKGVVQRRVDLLAAEGIAFVVNTEIGKDILAEELLAAYDAVVLCGGATLAREVEITGRELGGIHLAMDYLHEQTQRLLDDAPQDGAANDIRIDAKDKHVIVIGGGDTGSDCVATALRQGCQSVTQFGTHDRAPLTRDTLRNPWPEFPNVYKLDYAHEEAQALFGSDPREYSVLTKQFTGDEQGHVKELHTVRIKRYIDEQGRKIYQELPSTEEVWPADLVLISVGFAGPEPLLVNAFQVETDRRSNVRAREGKYVTSQDKVFAAGDMRRGQSLVVWAIHEGRGVARAVDAYLMGATLLPE